MKSAYELAMERLTQASPSAKLTEAQKQELAELDSQYAAKLAAREIALKTQMANAGNEEAVAALQEQLATDRRKLQAELEDKKEQVRQAGGA